MYIFINIHIFIYIFVYSYIHSCIHEQERGMKHDGAAAFQKGNEFAQGNELEFREYIDPVTGQRCVRV